MAPAIQPGSFYSEHAEVKCPYCGENARKVTGKEVYPHRKKLWKRRYLACFPCEAWVGCHEVKGHKWKPFGTMANRMLRRLRIRAHASFDRLWQSNFMSRWNAYKWLADSMGLDTKETHIGMFNEEQCNRVRFLSDGKFTELKEGLRDGGGREGAG